MAGIPSGHEPSSVFTILFLSKVEPLLVRPDDAIGEVLGQRQQSLAEHFPRLFVRDCEDIGFLPLIRVPMESFSQNCPYGIEGQLASSNFVDANVTKLLGLNVDFDPYDSQLQDGFSAISLFLVGGTNALNKPLEYPRGRNIMRRFLKSGAED